MLLLGLTGCQTFVIVSICLSLTPLFAVCVHEFEHGFVFVVYFDSNQKQSAGVPWRGLVSLIYRLLMMSLNTTGNNILFQQEPLCLLFHGKP